LKIPRLGFARWLRLALGLAAAAPLGAAAPALALVCGESVEATISTPSELDTYTFQAAAGDVMSISIGGPNRFSSFGVLAELRNPSNQTVPLRNIYDQSATNSFCAVHTTCETSQPLVQSGTYTIRITEFMANATGTYSLTLDAVGGGWNGGSNAPPTPACGTVTDGTTTIACGETVNGNLDLHADADTTTFFADAGDRVAFSVSRPVGAEFSVNPVLELFAPGGALVTFYDGAGNYCEFVSCAADPLPATGVYTVKLTDSGLTHTGAYSFTLESVAESFDGASNGPPSPVCSAAADGARSIGCGERVTGDISVTGDSDVFTFFADAGESLALVLEQPAGSTLVPMAELFAPDGSFLLRANGPPYPTAPIVSGPLPQSGVYSIKLTDFAEGEALDQTGAYALTLVSNRLDGSACGPLLSCGGTVSNNAAAGDVELFRFAARSGDAVRLQAAGTAAPSLALLAPDYSPLSQAAALPQTGVYTVVASAGASGSYRLTLEAVSGHFNGGGNGWPPLVCGSGVPDGSRSIECGQTLPGSLDLAGDSDTFTFLAEAGDVVTLAVDDVVAGFDPVAELFAPGGAPLVLSGEAVCGPSEACSSPSLPSAGAYTIRVLQPSGTTTGAYTLQMNRSPCASDCQDGIDNDGDGLIDSPVDLGCASAGDLSERRECNDGFDNDGDGLTDFAGGDVGCPTNSSTVEDPQCEDGRDNDLDGVLDWDGGGAGPADATCAGSPTGSVEAPPTNPACGLGPELALLLPLLARRRRSLSR